MSDEFVPFPSLQLQLVLVLNQIHIGVYVSLLVEGLAQFALEHVAWIIARLVLHELIGKVPSSIQVGLPLEVPGKAIQYKELANLVQVHAILFEEFFLETLIYKGFKNDVVVPRQVFPVKDEGLWVDEEDVMALTPSLDGKLLGIPGALVQQQRVRDLRMGVVLIAIFVIILFFLIFLLVIVLRISRFLFIIHPSDGLVI